VAINLYGTVAFGGRDGNAIDAAFTQERAVVREGETLGDTTLLDDINENGGIAINVFGQVAFHGDAIDAAVGPDAVAVKAVLTQAGVVAKEGDILPGGDILTEISDAGGVAINTFGQALTLTQIDPLLLTKIDPPRYSP